MGRSRPGIGLESSPVEVRGDFGLQRRPQEPPHVRAAALAILHVYVDAGFLAGSAADFFGYGVGRVPVLHGEIALALREEELVMRGKRERVDGPSGFYLS